MRVWNDDQGDVVPLLDLVEPPPLLVDQVGRDVHGDLGDHTSGLLLARLLADQPQQGERHRFDAADGAHPEAARAIDVRGLAQRRTQALTRHLEQPEARQAPQLDTRPVHLDRLAQHVLDRPLVRGGFHVDEVDDDQAADVPQAQLPRDLLGRFQVRVARRRLDVPAARAARGVDVDRHECLGLVDDEAAARRQGDLVRIGRLDLALDLVASEQRHRILVQLELALRIRRHEALHVFLRLLERIGLVDQTLADVVREVVAQATRHGIAFLVDQERRRPAVVRLFDHVPGGLQVIEVPLQFLGGAPDTGSAHDRAHAIRDLEAVHRLAHLVALLALDAARHAAGARVVRHQHEEAASQADEGGQCGTLVAALILFDLDDEFLAFLEHVLGVGAPLRGGVLREVFLRDLLQRQESMALCTIFDEGRFEAGLDARYAAFIDIGFFLFPGRDLNR